MRQVGKVAAWDLCLLWRLERFPLGLDRERTPALCFVAFSAVNRCPLNRKLLQGHLALIWPTLKPLVSRGKAADWPPVWRGDSCVADLQPVVAHALLWCASTKQTFVGRPTNGLLRFLAEQSSIAKPRGALLRTLLSPTVSRSPPGWSAAAYYGSSRGIGRGYWQGRRSVVVSMLRSSLERGVQGGPAAPLGR